MLKLVQHTSGLLALLLSMLLNNNNNSSINELQGYAVVFDAGSTGSRVHAFRFDQNMDLLPFSNSSYEFFLATKPGLSAYANDPNAAALSLKPLLEEARDIIPKELRSKTPVKLGATAGLRMLPGGASEAILEAVRNLLESDSTLYYKPQWVSILKGSDEGAYMWVTVNYLLGRLGGSYARTAAVVDLGGGSVQMSYAISDKSAAEAPQPAEGEDPFVSDRVVLGSQYHLYVHSYLNYGLRAGRAEALKLSGKGNPCITNGYQGTYDYNGVVYDVLPPSSGTNLAKCKALIRKTLKVDAPCSYTQCSFDGIWNGGGGKGQKDIYVASFYADAAREIGIMNQDGSEAVARPLEYLKAAKRACRANIDNINSTFPHIDERDVGFLCLDLVYEYTLLVRGFGIHPLRELKVISQIQYKGAKMGAAWPLGCAVELFSSLK